MKDRDLGFKEILRQFKSLKKKRVQAGILRDAGKGEEGDYIADYACYNEYGTSTIPARPFMSTTFDEKYEVWNKYVGGVVQSLLRGENIDLERSMLLLGERMVCDIKEKIASNVLPPLAASTRARKKSSKTLIDTGIMRNSINFEVLSR